MDRRALRLGEALGHGLRRRLLVAGVDDRGADAVLADERALRALHVRDGRRARIGAARRRRERRAGGQQQSGSEAARHSSRSAEVAKATC